jgi:hypothetical protein
VSARDRIQMQVKSHTYERAWYGTYHRQRFFSMEKLDTHLAKMLGQGWRVFSQAGPLGARARASSFCETRNHNHCPQKALSDRWL